MSSSAVITGAAPVWVAVRLAGPSHRAEIVHTGADALYLDSRSDVIGILSRHATPIPCAIATRIESLDALLGHRPRVGDTVEIGGGAVTVGPGRVRVGRHVDYAMRRFDRTAAVRMVARLEAASNASPRHDELEPDVLALLRDDPVAALRRVIGRGSGLTPFGDDVVCGLLATLLAVDDPCAPALRSEAVALAPERTTRLSATLLRRAGEGDVLPAFAELVSVLTDVPDQPEGVAARAARLLAIGHTSGSGMLLGLRLALAHINTRSCP